MLRDLDLLPVYDSEKYDLIHDLQVPLLQNSQTYLRGVGFFTSGWLRLASNGITCLAKSGGKAKIIVSPILDNDDWEAIKLGQQAKESNFLKNILLKNIELLESTLENDTRNGLSWMVADNFLEFRFAIPRDRNSGGDYHDKVGVFKDSFGYCVAIHGSLNDSIKASLNGEAFSVFKSWETGQFPYVQMHQQRLEMLWNDENKQFSIYKIPEAIKEKFIRLRISSEPPYLTKKFQKNDPTSSKNIKLYDYQDMAIKKWEEAGYKGIFEMATGTGKTITSLYAARNILTKKGSLAIIILVPFLHLLDQWRKNCLDLGFNPILCSSVHDNWITEIKDLIRDLNSKILKNICIIVVNKTAASEKFLNAIKKLSEKDTLLIGDEVHGLGARHLCNALTDKASLRLGLSATPRRWYDDEGTEIINNYFCGTCFEYTLEQAIGKFLTPYEYNPILIHLTKDELEQYEELTQKINTISSYRDKDNDKEDLLKKLLLQRSKVISTAQQKIPELINLLKNLQSLYKKSNKEPRGILIYCSPGTHKEVLQLVSNLGFRCHEFVHDVKIDERQRLLKMFDSGDIQILVAIKCLDEGVDVPSTQIAFILASSTNPREFIQRRGRILRISPGKEKSIIYDFIVTPQIDNIINQKTSELSILKREMPRFAEFSSSALNKFAARALIKDVLDRFGMLNLLDEKPWDIYNNFKKTEWSIYE